MKTNGPSTASVAAAVAGVLACPPRRATPETLSLDSVTTQPVTAASNTADAQVEMTGENFRSKVA